MEVREVLDNWRRANVASVFKEGQSALFQSEENHGTVLLEVLAV